MHVLLTNDDGIDAPGLAALEDAVSTLATVSVVAPYQCCSGCGHRVTTHHPVRVEQLAERRYKVYGTPADCTRLGLAELAPDVDWVLGGINDGGNLGVDLLMSGTVAAVREAIWLGKPGIAISQYARRDRPRDWEKARHVATRVIQELWRRPLGETEFWNVNLPDVDTRADDIELRDAFVEPRHLLIAYRRDQTGGYRCCSDYRQRPRTKGSDVDVCFGGAIAVCKVGTSG